MKPRARDELVPRARARPRGRSGKKFLAGALEVDDQLIASGTQKIDGLDLL